VEINSANVGALSGLDFVALRFMPDVFSSPRATFLTDAMKKAKRVDMNSRTLGEAKIGGDEGS
jgi:hypothetical protein